MRSAWIPSSRNVQLLEILCLFFSISGDKKIELSIIKISTRFNSRMYERDIFNIRTCDTHLRRNVLYRSISFVPFILDEPLSRSFRITEFRIRTFAMGDRERIIQTQFSHISPLPSLITVMILTFHCLGSKFLPGQQAVDVCS